VTQTQSCPALGDCRAQGNLPDKDQMPQMGCLSPQASKRDHLRYLLLLLLLLL
jgi:hypothetical protein